MKVRARYHLLPRPLPNVVAIVDLNDGAMSVTNDAENVIMALHREGVLHAGDRLIYCDTDSLWDELRFNDQFAFQGFGPLRETSVVVAAYKVVETPR